MRATCPHQVAGCDLCGQKALFLWYFLFLLRKKESTFKIKFKLKKNLQIKIKKLPLQLKGEILK